MPEIEGIGDPPDEDQRPPGQSPRDLGISCPPGGDDQGRAEAGRQGGEARKRRPARIDRHRQDDQHQAAGGCGVSPRRGRELRKEAQGNQQPQQQLPGTHVGQVEGRVAVDERAAGAESEGGQHHGGDERPQPTGPEPVHDQDEQRQEDVELLFDGERPGVDQRQGEGRGGEIAGAGPKVEVRDREDSGQHRLAIALELGRQHIEIGGHRGHEDQDGECREDAPRAPLVES